MRTFVRIQPFHWIMQTSDSVLYFAMMMMMRCILPVKLHQAKAHHIERVGWMLENVSDTLFNHFETLLHCSIRLLLRHRILAHFFIASSLLSLRHVASNDWRCYNECDFNRKQLINITTRYDALRYINHRSFSCLIKRTSPYAINQKPLFLFFSLTKMWRVER